MTEEDQICCQFMANVRSVFPSVEPLIYHVANGGRRNKAEAAKFKRMGVKAGVPDYCLALPKGGYHGLYLEVKTERGVATKEQRAFIEAARAQGYAAAVCYGARELWYVFEEYVTGNVAGITLELTTITRKERERDMLL